MIYTQLNKEVSVSPRRKRGLQAPAHNFTRCLVGRWQMEAHRIVICLVHSRSMWDVTASSQKSDNARVDAQTPLQVNLLPAKILTFLISSRKPCNPYRKPMLQTFMQPKQPFRLRSHCYNSRKWQSACYMKGIIGILSQLWYQLFAKHLTLIQRQVWMPYLNFVKVLCNAAGSVSILMTLTATGAEW